MAADRIKAEKDYYAGMKYKDIAQKHGVSLNTVKSWKRRYGWDRKKGAHKKEGAPKRPGAPKGSKNALGNRGGHGGPSGNKKALTHGLYATIVVESLDEEEQRLFHLSEKIEGLEGELQLARYKVARLVREQNKREMQGVAGSKDGPLDFDLRDDFYEEAIQKGLELVSRLESKINRFRIEQEKLQLAREKLDFEKAKANIDDGEYEDDGFIDALNESAEEVWGDET